jgi:hypothetical protein
MDQATETDLRLSAARMRDDPKHQPGPHKAWQRKMLIQAFALRDGTTLDEVVAIVDEVWP